MGRRSFVARISRGGVLSKFTKLWIGGVVLLVATQVVLTAVLRRGVLLTVYGDVAQSILVFSAAVSLLPNLFASKGRTRLFWALMAMGVTLWFLTQVLWTYVEVFLHTEAPNPFIGDVILFLHIVPMIAALAVHPHMQDENRVLRLGGLDFALLLTWWVYLYMFVVIPWQYVVADENLYGASFDVLYLTESAVLLFGLFLLWRRTSGSWRTIYGHLLGASLLYAISACVAGIAIDRHSYYTGSVYDIPLVAAMGWFTVAGLSGRKQSPATTEESSNATYDVFTARLAMLAILSTPFLAMFAEFISNAPVKVRSFRLLLTLAAGVALCAFLFLKQHLIDRRLLRLLAESRHSLDKQKRLQAQLVQSEKLASLGELVGGAAHEINNPLTAMMGYSDLLLATNPLTDEQRRLVEKVGYQVRRTKTLVDSLLNFAKQTPTEKTLLNINSVVQTAVKMVHPRLSSRNIRLEMNITNDLPQVLGDSHQLLQVCLHIMGNAVDALDGMPGGVVVVNTTRENGNVLVEFSDSGPGARDPNRVFDPFYTTKPVGKGTGLGLSACYGIVQEHGGRILCQNRTNGGAMFRIELPVAETAEKQEPASAPAKKTIVNSRPPQRAAETEPAAPRAIPATSGE
jgi:signal transduction histidine kinase